MAACSEVSLMKVILRQSRFYSENYTVDKVQRTIYRCYVGIFNPFI